MTSEALITAATLSPTFRPRSSTASLVMDDVTVTPWPRSTTTCAVVAPLWTSTTLPLSWLRALSFIIVLRHKRRRFSQPQSGRHSIRCDATRAAKRSSSSHHALYRKPVARDAGELLCGPQRRLDRRCSTGSRGTDAAVGPAQPGRTLRAAHPVRLSGILPPL